ncbi:hypothetical protein SAEN111111_19340 [Saccharibacillus endophyticus]
MLICRVCSWKESGAVHKKIHLFFSKREVCAIRSAIIGIYRHMKNIMKQKKGFRENPESFFRSQRDQPFTAPAVRPLTMYFWQNRYRMNTGSEVSTRSAKIRFQSRLNFP